MSELWGYAQKTGEAWIAKGILLPTMQERSLDSEEGQVKSYDIAPFGSTPSDTTQSSLRH